MKTRVLINLMDYIAKDIIERVVSNAMAEYLDKEAVEDKIVTPTNANANKRPKPTAPKKPKNPPKSAAIISSSSSSDEDENPAPSGVISNKPTKSDEEFIDDEGGDEGLDDRTQAQFDAMKRKEMKGKLKKKMEEEAKKRKRKDDSANLESTPKRIKLTKPKKRPLNPRNRPIPVDPVVSENEELDNEQQEEGLTEAFHTDSENEVFDEEQLELQDYYDHLAQQQPSNTQKTPEERIKANQCPFCFGPLAIGSTPDEKTGEEKLWAFCSKQTCKWTYVPPNKIHQFIVEAHMTLSPKYQYPSTKETCTHGLPLQATWVHDVSKMTEEDAAYLKGCIFLVCEITKKDKQNRVPCNKVILANPRNGRNPKPLEKRYRGLVIERKIAAKNTEKRFGFDTGTALARFKADPRNQRDFGNKKINTVPRRR